MSDGLDISFVKEMYRNLSDAELIRLASTDAQGLTAVAKEAIKEEIIFRKLDPGIIKAVDIQNKTIDINELNGYCELIKNSDCPKCGKPSVLNAIITSETMSFIIFTRQSKKLVIGCRECLQRENNTALFTTLGLGWWGMPWGVIRSIGSISNYIRAHNTLKNDEINDDFRRFVLAHIGLFQMYKDQPERLYNIVQNHSKGIASSANNV